MSSVLFLSDIALDNPRRGTPIHVARMLLELRRRHRLVVCAASVPDTLRDVFVQYPRLKGWGKLQALVRLVDTYAPDTILTIGQTGLLAPVILKYMRGVRIVVELQGVEYIEKYAAGHIGLLHFYLWKYKTMFLLPLYDAVIAFSKRTAHLYPFLRTVGIVYPAIDIDTVPQAKNPEPVPPLIVGYSGNTDAYQGLRHCIEAVACVRKEGLDARLHMVLTGNDAYVRALIDEYDLAHVTTIVRDVSHQEAQREMLKTSVFVIPRTNALESVYGFPSKLTECLAIGVPVVVTNVGAVPELMPELGHHAIVIPCENITNHLSGALQKVAHMSIGERKNHGIASRKYAEKFCWKNVIPVVSDVL